MVACCWLLACISFALAVAALPFPASEITGEYWIVMSSQGNDVGDVNLGLRLQSIQSFMEQDVAWNLVLITDIMATTGKFSEHLASLPRTVHLPAPLQLALSYESAKVLGSLSAPDTPIFARKNIGYLYAIQHGARFIFDTTDDFTLTVNLSSLTNETVFAAVDRNVNPYSYYGHPSLWPRGFPLADIAVESELRTLHAGDAAGPCPTATQSCPGSAGPNSPVPQACQCSSAGPLIRQTLLRGSPDLDRIFHLTRKIGDRSLNVSFVTKRTALVLAGQAYVPVNSLATLFRYDAFWATAIPFKAGSMADIWRGYWAQRVLRELTSVTVSFHGPVATRYEYKSPLRTNAASADGSTAQLALGDEVDMYQKSGLLQKFLREWQAPAEATDVPQTATHLAAAMAAAGFWSPADVMTIETFFKDLKAIGYEFPSLRKALITKGPADVTVQQLQVGQSSDKGLPVPVPEPVIQLKHYRIKTYVNGNRSQAWDIAHMQSSVAARWRDATVFNADKSHMLETPTGEVAPAAHVEYCTAQRHYGHTVEEVPSRPQLRVLFVVNFHWKNSASAESAQFLIDKIFAYYYNTPFDVVFVGPGAGAPGIIGNGQTEGGYYSYHSVTVAFQQYPNYDGYFLVNDDFVLVQPRMDTRLFGWRWQHPFNIGFNLRFCRDGLPPSTWEGFCPQAITAFYEMCGGEYSVDCGGPLALYKGQSDAFYIPGRFMQRFVNWSNVFLKHSVFLEIAVPTIVHALSDYHCLSGVEYEVEQGATALPLCTDWSNRRAYLHEALAGVASNCVGYHPIKLLGSDKDSAVNKTSAFLKSRVERYCKFGNPCTVQHKLQADGFLWVAS